MPYFVSPQAEYRANRIIQMLGEEHGRFAAAQRDGKVLANFQGHMHLFQLGRDGNLSLVASADITPKQQVSVLEIDG